MGYYTNFSLDSYHEDVVLPEEVTVIQYNRIK